jgi:ribosomal protein L24
MSRLRKGDQVIVLSGRDKGRKGSDRFGCTAG